jgi:phosphomannomutase
VKLLFGDDGWILARPSGTEPVLRVYCEAPTDAAVNAALEELLALVVK